MAALMMTTMGHHKAMMHSRMNQHSGKTLTEMDMGTIQTERNQTIVQWSSEHLILMSMDVQMQTVMEQVTPMTCGSMIHLNGSILMVTVGVTTGKVLMGILAQLYMELLHSETLMDASIMLEMAMPIQKMSSPVNRPNGPIRMAMDSVTISHLEHQDLTTGRLTRLVT